MRDGGTKLDLWQNYKLNCTFEGPECEGQYIFKVNLSEY